MDRRFEVTITVSIKETKDGAAVPFFDNDLKYSDLPYDGVLAVEEQLIGGLAALAKKGGEKKK